MSFFTVHTTGRFTGGERLIQQIFQCRLSCTSTITWGNLYIRPALQIFNAKSVAQLCYGVPIWTPAFHSSMERVRSMVLYKIVGLPHCVSYLTLFFEAGQHRLGALAWLRFFKYWVRISPQDILFQALLSDNVFPKGLALFIKKIKTLGLSPDMLGSIPPIPGIPHNQK